MKHWAIGVLLVFICCLPISCADIADDGNLNTPSPRIAWLDRIVRIELGDDADRIVSSDGETMYTSDGELLGLTAAGGCVYFLEREANGGSALSRDVTIGRIDADGTVHNLTSELFSDSEIHNELGFIRILDGKIFISGASAYGDAYLCDPEAGNISSRNMPATNALDGANIYYTDGGYEIYRLTTDNFTGEAEIYYDGSDFVGWEDEEFYVGVGIEHLCACEGKLYFTVSASDGYRIYSYDGELSKLYTNELPVRQLQYYNGKLYYSDDNGIWCLLDEPQWICELYTHSGEPEQLQMFTCDFVIHSGRLYYDIDDLTVYEELG